MQQHGFARNMEWDIVATVRAAGLRALWYVCTSCIHTR
jgi:D-hexose-6-phosphate mutarotase